MNYRVEVDRTETVCLSFDIEADSEEDAIDIAERRASGYDYSETRGGSVEYESHIMIDEVING
jgi:hypothetical protein